MSVPANGVRTWRKIDMNFSGLKLTLNMNIFDFRHVISCVNIYARRLRHRPHHHYHTRVTGAAGFDILIVYSKILFLI